MLKPISEITGSLALEPGASNSTGPQHGGRGSAVTVSGEVEAARAWLVSRTPAEVDAELLERARSSHGVTISLTTELRFPEDRPAYRVATGAALQVTDPGQVPALAQTVRDAMVTPTPLQADKWFLALRLATAGARKSEMDEAATIALYTNTLGKYPADVSKAVFHHFTTAPRTDTSWFPTLPEMVAKAEELASPRRSLLASLLAWKPETEDQRRDRTVRALMLEAHNAREDAQMCRRSNPEKHAELMAWARNRDAKAAQIRRREIEP